MDEQELRNLQYEINEKQSKKNVLFYKISVSAKNIKEAEFNLEMLENFKDFSTKEVVNVLDVIGVNLSSCHKHLTYGAVIDGTTIDKGMILERKPILQLREKIESARSEIDRVVVEYRSDINIMETELERLKTEYRILANQISELMQKMRG